jgi:hypothetical protein
VAVTAADNAVAINVNTSVRHHHGGCGRFAMCAPLDKVFDNEQVKLARAGQPKSPPLFILGAFGCLSIISPANVGRQSQLFVLN